VPIGCDCGLLGDDVIGASEDRWRCMCIAKMARLAMKRILVDKLWLAGAHGQTLTSQGVQRDKRFKAC
jgi:hypothetical protein